MKVKRSQALLLPAFPQFSIHLFPSISAPLWCLLAKARRCQDPSATCGFTHFSQLHSHGSLDFELTSLTVLTSAPVSNTIPANSSPETNGFKIRLSIKPSTMEVRKSRSTGHPTNFLKRRWLKHFPLTRRRGVRVCSHPKHREVNLRFSTEKLQQPVLTKTQIKISRMGKSTENHRFASTSDPDHWGA